jgi:hypothetical protein
MGRLLRVESPQDRVLSKSMESLSVAGVLRLGRFGKRARLAHLV